MTQDKLELRYVPLAQARRWDENPKLHDIDALTRSIVLHGFGDPPKYDANLDGLVYGNGRTEALERLRQGDKPAPRGVLELEDGGWAIPVIFGCDAESKAAAVAFAIDHNNLALSGSDFGFTERLALWDEGGLQHVLTEVPDASEFLVSLDPEEVTTLLDGPTFEAVSPEEQSRLDRKRDVTCPDCGRVFRP